MKEHVFRNIAVALIITTTILALAVIVSTADAARVAAAASIAVAGSTLLLALVTYKAVAESEKATEQNQYALARPLLVPTNPINQEDLANARERPVDIANVGSGVALNIHGLLMPISHPVAGLPQQLSMHHALPLQPGDVKDVRFEQGGTIFRAEDAIASIPVSVPAELEIDEGIPDTMDRKERVVARLTLTYEDLFSRIHSSVFDLTQQDQWIAVAIQEGVDVGIREIDQAKTRPRKPRRTSPNEPGTLAG